LATLNVFLYFATARSGGLSSFSLCTSFFPFYVEYPPQPRNKAATGRQKQHFPVWKLESLERTNYTTAHHAPYAKSKITPTQILNLCPHPKPASLSKSQYQIRKHKKAPKKYNEEKQNINPRTRAHRNHFCTLFTV
jgi:hypothetical protein